MHVHRFLEGVWSVFLKVTDFPDPRLTRKFWSESWVSAFAFCENTVSFFDKTQGDNLKKTVENEAND